MGHKGEGDATNWEKIFAVYTSNKELNTQNIKRTLKNQQEKN